MVSHIPYISLDTYPKVRGTRIKDVAMLIPFTSREPAMFCLIALVLEFLLFKILFRNVFIIGDMLLEFIWDRCRWLICMNVYIFSCDIPFRKSVCKRCFSERENKMYLNIFQSLFCLPDLTIYPAYDREGSKRLPKRVSEIGDAKFEVNKLLQLFFYFSNVKKSDS